MTESVVTSVFQLAPFDESVSLIQTETNRACANVKVAAPDGFHFHNTNFSPFFFLSPKSSNISDKTQKLSRFHDRHVAADSDVPIFSHSQSKRDSGMTALHCPDFAFSDLIQAGSWVSLEDAVSFQCRLLCTFPYSPRIVPQWVRCSCSCCGLPW